MFVADQYDVLRDASHFERSFARLVFGQLVCIKDIEDKIRWALEAFVRCLTLFEPTVVNLCHQPGHDPGVVIENHGNVKANVDARREESVTIDA